MKQQHNANLVDLLPSPSFGRAIAQTASRLLVIVTARVRAQGRSYMGFVVEKPALGQLFSEYFGFPCQFSF
jgi:hypothetical protein